MARVKLSLNKKRNVEENIDKDVEKEEKETEIEDTEIESKKKAFLYYFADPSISPKEALRKAGVLSQATLHNWTRTDENFKTNYFELKKDRNEKEKNPVALKNITGTNTRMLQESVIEAYRYSNFNLTEACNQVGIRRSVASGWLKNDPWFKEAMDEFNDEKNDLIEEMLLMKVAQGDTQAVLYAARCRLKENYNPDSTLQVEMTVSRSKEERDAIINAAIIDPSSILSTPAGKMLTEKIREKRGLTEGNSNE